MNRVLITGATGTTGSRVAADLFQTAKLNLAIVGNFRKLERFEARLAI